MTEPSWAQLQARPWLRRTSPATLRAAWWAYTASRKARRELRTEGLRTTVDPPPHLPWGSRGGVFGVLRRLDPTCLERALVLQAWLVAHDIRYDVVIGVRDGESGAVKAHAWVDQVASPSEWQSYTVIHRLPAR